MKMRMAVLLVARVDDQYAGYCALDTDPYQKYNAAYISMLYVRPKRRGVGVGGALVDSAVSVVRDLSIPAIELLVHSSEGMDAVARHLYLRKGFERKQRTQGLGELMIRKI